MCGIVGIWKEDGRPAGAPLVRAMVDSIRHRGPDDEGYIFFDRVSGESAHFSGPDSPREITAALPPIDAAQGDAVASRGTLALGHRRFSIISPSPLGHQPFWDGRREVCLVFNGEIYNYVELRAELSAMGHSFRTETDTEVLVEAYRAWGVESFSRLNGMWAIALYDVGRRELVLSRDRTGERPLYLADRPEGTYFASEIRALLLCPGHAPRAEASSVYSFLHAPTVGKTEEETFFQGVRLLPAGSWLRLGEGGRVESARFWSLPTEPRLTESQIGIADAGERLRELFRESVDIRLRADVPVNVALSGGMDSSSVVAMAAEVRGAGVETYTVRFPDSEWNEWPFAAKVAARCRVRNLVVDPPASWMLGYLGPFVEAMEEPFHAPDLLTDHVVRRILARQGIRVSLSGIGGDEIFAGYTLYRWLHAADLRREGRVLGWAGELLLASDRIPLDAARAALVHRLRGTTRPSRARGLTSDAVVGFDAQVLRVLPQELGSRLRADFESVLLPYWLRVGDKSSMAVPIEVRYPFLDHRLIEFASSLPASYLVRRGWLKWILRKAMGPLLPPEVIWRRTKMGYPSPVGDWLRGALPELRIIFAEMDNEFLSREFWTGRLEEAIHTDPFLAWRALSLELWHRRFIRGLPVFPDEVRERAPEVEIAA